MLTSDRESSREVIDLWFDPSSVTLRPAAAGGATVKSRGARVELVRVRVAPQVEAAVEPNCTFKSGEPNFKLREASPLNILRNLKNRNMKCPSRTTMYTGKLILCQPV